jgi:hypothetical protein
MTQRTPTNIDVQFIRFHFDNPDVYRKLVDMARNLKLRGHETVGIGMLFEVIRWQTYMETIDMNSDFKLNNNYRSRYARLIMDQEPYLAGMFNIRELTS